MANLDNTPKFLNGRDWRTFLAGLHSALPYPRLVDTLKSGHAWVSNGAAQTSNWLLAGLTSPATPIVQARPSSRAAFE